MKCPNCGADIPESEDEMDGDMESEEPKTLRGSVVEAIEALTEGLAGEEG